MRLREALQAVERGGMIEYSLGGHHCARPPAVQQGQSDDCFTISPDANNELLWRPNAVQAKALKGANLASHFPYKSLSESPLVLVLLVRLECKGFVFECLWKGVGIFQN